MNKKGTVPEISADHILGIGILLEAQHHRGVNTRHKVLEDVVSFDAA